MAEYTRGSTGWDRTTHGDCTADWCVSDEPGYAGLSLTKIELPAEALLAAARCGIRVLAQGGWEELESAPGRILFGRYKGDRLPVPTPAIAE
jgi:hypothetical protein